MKVNSRIKEQLPADAYLTRYVDIHTFLYFITQNKLRFARLDTFEDLNEGFSTYTAEAVKKFSADSRAIRQIAEKDKMMAGVAALRQQHSELEERYHQHQKDLFACCWYMGEKESVAMWNLYSNPDSVAIRFNANDLIRLVEETASKDDQHFAGMQYGTVQYIDLSSAGASLKAEAIGFIK